MTGTWPLGWATGDLTLAAQYAKGIGAISDTTLVGSAANVDISSISGTYAHLLAVVYARCDAGITFVPLKIQFNGDTGANYDSQQLQGTAAAASAAETFAATSMVAGYMAAPLNANLFGAAVIFIPHYAGSSNNKLALSMSSVKNGTSSGSLASYLTGGFWRSSAAINRVTLLPSSGNFVAGTRVTLYGLGA